MTKVFNWLSVTGYLGLEIRSLLMVLRKQWGITWTQGERSTLSKRVSAKILKAVARSELGQHGDGCISWAYSIPKYTKMCLLTGMSVRMWWITGRMFSFPDGKSFSAVWWCLKKMVPGNYQLVSNI